MIEYKTAQKEDFGQILNLNQKYIKRNKILWELLDSDIENHLDLPHSVIAKIDDSLAGYLLSFDLMLNQNRQQKDFLLMD